MKIGILSMQRIFNYGSWLQAYALKKMLESYDGIEVEFADYRVRKPLGISMLDYAKQKVKVLLVDALTRYKWGGNIPNRNFHQVFRFRTEYQRLLSIGYSKNYSPKVDTLLIGSDEVFNCFQRNVRVGYSKELFGQNSRAGRICSYAASFGNTTIEKIERAGKAGEIGLLLCGFYRISVRDSNSAHIVEALTGIKPEMHMDPTLIYDFREELKTVKFLQNRDRPYMIVYAYPNRMKKSEIDLIKGYAKDKNLDIYAVNGCQKFADRMIYDSPINILGCFRDASCVVTDTFHGTIMSVINQKPFVTIVRPSLNGVYGNQEKLDDLLGKLHLADRSVQELTDVSWIMDSPIDYQSIGKVIEAEKLKANQYLKDVTGYGKD